MLILKSRSLIFALSFFAVICTGEKVRADCCDQKIICRCKCGSFADKACQEKISSGGIKEGQLAGGNSKGRFPFTGTGCCRPMNEDALKQECVKQYGQAPFGQCGGILPGEWVVNPIKSDGSSAPGDVLDCGEGCIRGDGNCQNPVNNCANNDS